VNAARAGHAAEAKTLGITEEQARQQGRAEDSAWTLRQPEEIAAVAVLLRVGPGELRHRHRHLDGRRLHGNDRLERWDTGNLRDFLSQLEHAGELKRVRRRSRS